MSMLLQFPIPGARDDPAWAKWQGGMAAAPAPGVAPQVGMSSGPSPA